MEASPALIRRRPIKAEGPGNLGLALHKRISTGQTLIPRVGHTSNYTLQGETNTHQLHIRGI